MIFPSFLALFLALELCWLNDHGIEFQTNLRPTYLIGTIRIVIKLDQINEMLVLGRGPEDFMRSRLQICEPFVLEDNRVDFFDEI